MLEEIKRGRGRPRTGQETRQKVTRSFSPQLLRAMEGITEDQSNFIEDWMWQHPKLIEWLKQEGEK